MLDKYHEILEAVQEAELILIGLGEEFDAVDRTTSLEQYECGKKILMQSKFSSFIPAWQRLHSREQSLIIKDRLYALADILKDKNYFVVSVATNRVIMEVPWREGRLVMPCGSDIYKQCSSACENNLNVLSEEEEDKLDAKLQCWGRKLVQKEIDSFPEWQEYCPKCKADLSLNNIYNEQYDENGYLPAWQLYMKWLQGTVNKKVVVLELGVGMKFPSVIRFPFEKVAYFNRKARFYRINKNLYHLTEELAGKGEGIADNAIDWLGNLC